MTESPPASRPEPGLLQSFLPVFILIVLLWGSVMLFGDESSSGPNQIALILAASAGILVGIYNGYTWTELQDGIVKGIGLSMGAILILLAVGALIGTWIMAGIVPTMIYYGLQILHPSIFFLASCAISAVVSLATGSSWTTASTIGIALIGIAGALELSTAIAAGAIISGAYFGDKLSPLSDTTNLAPAMVGTELFTHIRHMMWTTVPSMTIAMTLFGIIGFTQTSSGNGADLGEVLTALDSSFNLGLHLLIPPVIVILLVIKRMPAFPAILLGALIGGLFAALFQTGVVVSYAAADGLPTWIAVIKGVWKSLFGGYAAVTGNEGLDKLLSRGGMTNMLNTIWLIMSAMTFGAVMETTRMLHKLADSVLGFVRSTGSLVASTLATSIGCNIIASDQYIAIVLPGRMFRAEFERRGLHPKNLSRIMEDSGTLTSPLIPWNTCGAFMSQTLGVATFAYLPFCFLNLCNPVISAFYGFTGFTMEKLQQEPEGEVPAHAAESKA